jgi:hypothetical protein
MNPALAPYIVLLRSLGLKEISVADFEKKFLYLYKNDTTEWSESEFAVLDKLFGAVDAFCADARLRSVGDLDESQLYEAGKIAWKDVHNL